MRSQYLRKLQDKSSERDEHRRQRCSKGGSHSKRRAGIYEAVRRSLHKDPVASATAIRKSLSAFTEYNALRVSVADSTGSLVEYEVYCEGEEICEVGPDARTRTLRWSSLPRYVRDIKKGLASS